MISRNLSSSSASALYRSATAFATGGPSRTDDQTRLFRFCQELGILHRQDLSLVIVSSCKFITGFLCAGSTLDKFNEEQCQAILLIGGLRLEIFTSPSKNGNATMYTIGSFV